MRALDRILAAEAGCMFSTCVEHLTADQLLDEIKKTYAEAREELAALRAALNDAQVQEYMSRCRGDVLADLNDHLRAENAAMREALALIATTPVADIEQRRINAAEATRLLGLDQEPT